MAETVTCLVGMLAATAQAASAFQAVAAAQAAAAQAAVAKLAGCRRDSHHPAGPAAPLPVRRLGVEVVNQPRANFKSQQSFCVMQNDKKIARFGPPRSAVRSGAPETVPGEATNDASIP